MFRTVGSLRIALWIVEKYRQVIVHQEFVGVTKN